MGLILALTCQDNIDLSIREYFRRDTSCLLYSLITFSIRHSHIELLWYFVVDLWLLWLLCTLWCLIKVPPLINFWKCLTEKWSNFDVKSVISCQVIILSIHFVVRITSLIQALILELVLPPMGVSSRDHLRHPLIKTPVY